MMRTLVIAVLLLGAACGPASDGGEGGGATGDASGSGVGGSDSGDDGMTGGDPGSASGSGSGSGPGSASVDTSPDATGEDACWAAWVEPVASVTAPSRPDPATSPGMTLDFDYELGSVVLTSILEEQIVQPSEGPFSPKDTAGTWAELRDASDAILYTQAVFTLVPEAIEAAGAGWAPMCPETGSLRLHNFANDPAATEIVFFQEAIDGTMTSVTIELLRFTLP